MLRRTLLLCLSALVLYYLGEDLALRYRIPRSREPFGSITVHRYDAIRQKNGKVDYEYENPLAVTCVHALFPHLSYAPCWYVARHTEQQIDY